MNQDTVIIWMATFVIVSVSIVGYLIFKKRKNINLADGNVLAHFVTSTGITLVKWVPYHDRRCVFEFVDGEIKPKSPVPVVQQDKRRGRKPNEDKITGAGTYFFDPEQLPRVRWPCERGFMAITSVDAPWVVWNEGDPEPKNIRTGTPMIGNPELINAYRNENFVIMSAAYEEKIQEQQQQIADMMEKWIRPLWIWITLAIAVLAVIGNIVMYVLMNQNLAKINEALGL